MQRKEFIKINALGLLGLSTMSFSSFNDEIPEALLVGKTTNHLDASGVMHKSASAAFSSMKAAANGDGINLEIVSGFRSFDRQMAIWNRKYLKYQKQGLSHDEIVKKIILYSTIPGTSRHHWGTDIDIIDGNAKRPKGDLLVENNYHGNGPYSKLKKWMETNSEKFGFYLVYDNDQNRTGFEYEPWHYSYLPLSVEFLRKYLQIDVKKYIFESKMKGNNLFSEQQLNAYIQTHVKGIHPILLPS